MSELEKRRRKFMIQIKRKANEEYFRARREVLMREDEPQCQDLQRLVKRSLDKNGLNDEIEKIVQELKQVIAKGEVKQKYEYILALCSNLLIDDLKLQQKEAITILMYEIYQFLCGNMSNKVIQRISYSLVNFSNALPCLHQQFTDDCQHLLYRMIHYMLGMIIQWQPSQPATQIAKSIIQALNNTIYFQPQYMTQLQSLFSQNLTFFDQLIKYHRLLMADRNKMHYRVLREGILRIFEHVSNEIVLNQHPVIFQSTHFIDFVISEIMDGGTSQWQRKAFNILTNLLIDYKETEYFSLFDGLDRGGEHCVQTIIRNLLVMDCNTWHRLKLLKTIISIKQVYNHLKPFFEVFWRQVVDFCVQMLRRDSVDIIRLSAQILLILGDVTTNKDAYLNYMRIIGCKPVFQHLLFLIQETRQEQMREEAEDISAALSQILFNLKQDWLA